MLNNIVDNIELYMGSTIMFKAVSNNPEGERVGFNARSHSLLYKASNLCSLTVPR